MSLISDGAVLVPQLTKTWHTDTYPGIDPSQPSLTQDKRTIVITGGHTPLGRATVLAFADAGAHHIIMLGGLHATELEETRGIVLARSPKCCVEWYNVDISHVGEVQDAVGHIKAGLGANWRWDCLVLCQESEETASGQSATEVQGRAEIDNSSTEDRDGSKSWQTFKVGDEVARMDFADSAPSVTFHTPVIGALPKSSEDRYSKLIVKSNFFITRALLPTRSPTASLIAIASRAVCTTQASELRIQSAHICSNMALIKYLEVIAAQYPALFVASFCPGGLPTETPELGAHFTVWLCSPDARFLRSRFVLANWDIEQLKGMAGHIKADPRLLTGTIGGWPPVSKEFPKKAEGMLARISEEDEEEAEERDLHHESKDASDDSIHRPRGSRMPGSWDTTEP